MWQVHESSHGAHLVRHVVYPLKYQHGRHLLQQVLDVDAASGGEYGRGAQDPFL